MFHVYAQTKAALGFQSTYFHKRLGFSKPNNFYSRLKRAFWSSNNSQLSVPLNFDSSFKSFFFSANAAGQIEQFIQFIGSQTWRLNGCHKDQATTAWFTSTRGVHLIQSLDPTYFSAELHESSLIYLQNTPIIQIVFSAVAGCLLLHHCSVSWKMWKIHQARCW